MTAHNDKHPTSIAAASGDTSHRIANSTGPLSTQRCRYARHTVVAFAVFLATALLVTTASANTETTPDTQVQMPASKVMRATLDNGLNVVVIANHLAPAVTSVMTYNVGSRQAPADFPGRAHALEHMMFRGTDSLAGTQIAAIGGALGGRFNASTATEATQYYFTVPAEYLGIVLQLQAERMKSAAITPSDWHKERGAIKKEVGSNMSNPGYIAYQKLREQLFHGTPYSHDALGTKASFNKTTAAMLGHFYDKWYAPNNATLVIAGDVKPRSVIDKVRKFFGDMPGEQLPARHDIELPEVNSEPIRMKTDRGVGMVYLAYRGPGTNRIQRYATLKVLATILSEPRGRLYSELVTHGPALGASFSFQSMRAASIAFVSASFPKGTNTTNLVNHLKQVLDRIVEQDVTRKQVAAAKRQLATSAAAASDSIPSQAQRWARAVAVRQYQSPGALLKRIQQVNAADVNQLAQQILGENTSVLTVLTPGYSSETSAGNSGGDGNGGNDELFTPEHIGDVTLPEWAAKPLQSIKVPERTVHPEVATLNNGVKLITVTADAVQAVHVYGHILNNPALETPPGEAGVSRVLGRLLTYGTDKRGRRAFEAAVNRIGASLTAGTSFSLTVLPHYFEHGLALLAEKQLHPALPKNHFTQVKRRVAAAVAGQIHSPDFLANRALHKGLYPQDDPTLRHATPESVKSLTRKDVVDYYNKVFRPDLTTIVVVSSLPVDKVKQAVKEQFGSWSANGEPPKVTLDPVPPNKGHHFHVTDKAKTQTTVTMAQTLDVADKLHDYHALQLGTQILTGGFYASLLYSELRGERGLVYYVGSHVGIDRERSTLSLRFGAAPKHVDKASRIIRQTLKQMANEPVGAVQLHRARAGLIRQIPLQIASADSIARGLLRRERLNLPLNAPYRAARDYLEISAKDIQQVFAKYARPKELVRVIQGPAPSG